MAMKKKSSIDPIQERIMRNQRDIMDALWCILHQTPGGHGYVQDNLKECMDKTDRLLKTGA